MRKCVMAIQDKVIVKPDEEPEISEGGIIIPKTVQQQKRAQRGVVVAVGPGRHLENGQIAKMQVKPGWTVWFTEFAGYKITKFDNGEEKVDLLALNEKDITAIEAYDSEPVEEVDDDDSPEES